MPTVPVRCRGAKALLVAGFVCGLGILLATESTARQQTGQPAAPLQHPALANAPRLTQTRGGIAGDPINVALVGTQEQVVEAMVEAGWRGADPITLRSCLRLVATSVFHLSYRSAPVSDLYLWQRKQDLAFEQPVGKGLRHRHHVRFWCSQDVDALGRPLWLGAATYDSGIEFSHTTGLITHHIAPTIDAERHKLLRDLVRWGLVNQLFQIDHFHQHLSGRNGEGDRYTTDGRLMVAVLLPPLAAVGR